MSPNPGGKPKKLREIEAMLDAEHRTVENMREVYRTLRSLAVDGVEQTVFWQGAPCGVRVVYDKGFMELYLNRVQGPVEQLKVDLHDAPDEVVAWLAEHLN